ncbi:MAG: DUF2791 family P-loop domain-containing protein [Dehalococcoidales bacterium]|nr:DUF2791 family P-loop domain-containing protein [Dehalococcoidales bacterium]
MWAGRYQLKVQVENMIRRLGRNSVSTLNLMWADFGAGKTHTLYYVEFVAGINRLFPVYVEWPKKTTTFVDVYRGIASHFSLRVLSRLFWRCCEQRGVDKILDLVSGKYPDFGSALERIYEHKEDTLIYEWLRAQPGLSKKELTTIGIRNPIRTSDDAIQSLVVLVDLIEGSGDYVRLLLMLDEFQRIDHLPPRIRRDVNAGIHTLLNACPQALSILLSFSFGKPENIRFLLPEEVRSRADLDSLQLPQMNPEEALEFVSDLLNCYRSCEGAEPFFPFTKDSCQAILQEAGRLTPRRIMKHFDVVLRRADEDIASGRITHITPAYAKQILQQLPMVDEQEDHEG